MGFVHAPPLGERSPMPKTRILVVEDDPKTADSVRLYLEHAGFDVWIAREGRAGLERARENPPPHLIVLDRMLPHVDGLTMCRLLREESDVPILLLTARTTEEDRI